MSKMDDRLRRLIDDRVNDLERLFLTSEGVRDDHSMEDCCQDVLRQIRELRTEVDKVSEEIQRLPSKEQPLNESDIRDIFENHSDPSNKSGEESSVDPIEEHVNEHGMPRSLKDFLEILGAVLGGYTAVNSWPKFLKWLWGVLPYLLTSMRLLPLLTFIASIWRGIQDAVNDAADRMDRIEVLNRLSKMQQDIDDLSKLLAEISTGMQPGTETSMLLDRLNDIYTRLQDYYNHFDAVTNDIHDLLLNLHSDMIQRFDLIHTDDIMIRSDVACLAQWVKGDRNCDEFSSDVVTMLDVLQSTASTVKCNLDDYYSALSSTLAECCSSMSQRISDLVRGCEEIKHRLDGPDNPLDNIENTVNQGNVVGTGSLVLNYANDLNVIKAMLTDIRRLL